MKSVSLFCFVILLSFVSIGQTPRAGQLKITIEAVTCINKSWDGLIEFDGHGNEVFLNYAYRIYNPATPANFKSGAGFSPTFGSTGDGRIKVGTASPIGGIDNGNSFVTNTLVFNERIEANDVILLSPAVWERDNNNNGMLNQFNQQLATDLNWIMTQPYPFLNQTIVGNDPFLGRAFKTTEKFNSYWPITKYNFMGPLFNVQENRPIGVRSGTFQGSHFALYDPRLIMLDTRALISLINYNRFAAESKFPHRYGPISNVIQMGFKEDTYNITTSNGEYSIALRIEFAPDSPPAETPVPTPAPVSGPTKVIKKVPIATFPNQVPNTVAVKLVGRWAGSYGIGENSTGYYYSFHFNGDGTLLLIDEAGNAMGRGTYSFTNNSQVSGNYNDKNGISYNFTGLTATNKLSGTWVNANTASETGKFTMTKL